MGLLKLGSIYKIRIGKRDKGLDLHSELSYAEQKTELLPLDLSLYFDPSPPLSRSERMLPRSQTMPAGSGSLLNDIIAELQENSTTNAVTAAFHDDLHSDLSMNLALSEQLQTSENTLTAHASAKQEVKHNDTGIFGGDSIYSKFVSLEKQPEKASTLEASIFGSFLNPDLSSKSQAVASIPETKPSVHTVTVLDSDDSGSEEGLRSDSEDESEESEQLGQLLREHCPTLEKNSPEAHLVKNKASFTSLDIKPNEASESMIRRMKDRHRQQFILAAARQQQQQQQEQQQQQLQKYQQQQQYYQRLNMVDSVSMAPTMSFIPPMHSLPSIPSMLSMPPVMDVPCPVERPITPPCSLKNPLRRSPHTSPALSLRSTSTGTSISRSSSKLSLFTSSCPSTDEDADDEAESDSSSDQDHIPLGIRRTRFKKVLSVVKDEDDEDFQNDDNNDPLPRAISDHSIHFAEYSPQSFKMKQSSADGSPTDEHLQPKKLRSSRSVPNLKNKVKQNHCHGNSCCYGQEGQDHRAAMSNQCVAPPRPKHMKAEPQARMDHTLSAQYSHCRQQQLQIEWERMQTYQYELQLKQQYAQQFFLPHPAVDRSPPYFYNARPSGMPFPQQPHTSFFQNIHSMRQ